MEDLDVVVYLASQLGSVTVSAVPDEPRQSLNRGHRMSHFRNILMIGSALALVACGVLLAGAPARKFHVVMETLRLEESHAEFRIDVRGDEDTTTTAG